MSDSTHERVAIDAARYQERVSATFNPAPAPMTAEQMLRGLIQANKAEAVIAEEAFDHARSEVLRLDAIREGLEAALKAVRYPKASAPSPSPQ